MSIWRWAKWLDRVPARYQLTLGEGDTPLIPSRRIGPELGMDNLWFKLETGNPAGSFKDRFAAAAVSHMLAAGDRHCVATSSGNTGAALAAYCAAAGMDCRIAIVETAPPDKLKQMLAYGATIARVERFGIDPEMTQQVFEVLREMGSRPHWSLQISAFVYSAAGMRGVETIAYELAEQDGAIEHVFCPAGGGGLCVAVARGFEQAVKQELVRRSPAIECVQPAGNDTIASRLRDGADQACNVDCTTRISGLQVASVVDGNLAIAACRSSGGSGHTVPDEEVWAVQQRLARDEGIFSEPAGAVALAGAIQAAREERIARDARVVCLVTGSGFKDGTSLDRMIIDSDCPLFSASQLQQWQ